MDQFKLVAPYAPNGDQPQAIQELVDGINNGVKEQTLLGATGTGKTFTIANVIQEVNKPTAFVALERPFELLNISGIENFETSNFFS